MIEIEGEAPLFIEPYTKTKKVYSKEVIEKLRVAHLGKKMPNKYVPVVALNDDGSLFKEYCSVKDAAEEVCPDNPKTCAKAITQVINKKGGYDNNGKYHIRKKSHGYRWLKLSDYKNINI